MRRGEFNISVFRQASPGTVLSNSENFMNSADMEHCEMVLASRSWHLVLWREDVFCNSWQQPAPSTRRTYAQMIDGDFMVDAANS